MPSLECLWRHPRPSVVHNADGRRPYHEMGSLARPATTVRHAQSRGRVLDLVIERLTAIAVLPNVRLRCERTRWIALSQSSTACQDDTGWLRTPVGRFSSRRSPRSRAAGTG